MFTEEQLVQHYSVDFISYFILLTNKPEAFFSIQRDDGGGVGGQQFFATVGMTRSPLDAAPAAAPAS